MANRPEYQRRADQNYESKRKEKPRINGFYVGEDDIKRLNELTSHFNETRTEILIRAIKIMHSELTEKND